MVLGVPLFQRTVLLGGSAYAPWSLVESMESNSMKLARMLNCTTRHWGAGSQQADQSYFQQNLQAENPYSRDNQQFGSESASPSDYPHLISRGSAPAGGVHEYQPQNGLGQAQIGMEYRSSMPGMQQYHQRGHVHLFEPPSLSEAESDSIWLCLRNTQLKEFMLAVSKTTNCCKRLCYFSNTKKFIVNAMQSCKKHNHTFGDDN